MRWTNKLELTMAVTRAKRVAEGTCRHCGGSVPCWSPFGDMRVGRLYPTRLRRGRALLKAYKERRLPGTAHQGKRGLG